MNPKTSALALAMTAAVGCTPTRSELRRDAVLPPLGFGASAKGQLIAPKRCDLRLATLSRPLNDPVLNEVLWTVADEQAVEPEARRALEANGLRVGLIAGSLPREVEEALTAPPPQQVQPSRINIPNGDNTLYAVSPATAKASLILNRANKVGGKDYTDASGFLRLTPSHDGPAGVALRIVPELHHGPIRQGYTADSSSSPFAVAQFVMTEGQQEDTLRELAAGLTLQPGQVAVIGCRPERERSLGTFLFTEPEANSDRLLQKVLLVWASQASAEPPAIAPGARAAEPPEPAPSTAPIGDGAK